MFVDVAIVCDPPDARAQASDKKQRRNSKRATEQDEEDTKGMPEPLLTIVLRRLYNLWPCYWGTGVRLKYIAKDFREMRLEVPLTGGPVTTWEPFLAGACTERSTQCIC